MGMTDTILLDAFLAAVKFNDSGLVPVIAQRVSGEVLMLAWMNRATLEETLESGEVVYWSRSRKSRWRKGETSGNVQRLSEAYIDCDGDTVLLKVEQHGSACHTGAPTCFFRKLAQE
jgi:phosphoribosyl-AMP cyclohydrolase